MDGHTESRLEYRQRNVTAWLSAMVSGLQSVSMLCSFGPTLTYANRSQLDAIIHAATKLREEGEFSE